MAAGLLPRMIVSRPSLTICLVCGTNGVSPDITGVAECDIQVSADGLPSFFHIGSVQEGDPPEFEIGPDGGKPEIIRFEIDVRIAFVDEPFRGSRRDYEAKSLAPMLGISSYPAELATRRVICVRIMERDSRCHDRVGLIVNNKKETVRQTVAQGMIEILFAPIRESGTLHYTNIPFLVSLPVCPQCIVLRESPRWGRS